MKTRAFAGFSKLLAALLVTIASCAYAAESPTALRLATVDNFPPFSYMGNSNLTGIDVDFVHEMARRLGISVRIQPVNFTRHLDVANIQRPHSGIPLLETEKTLPKYQPAPIVAEPT